ncbi:hypothetical protein CEXT_667711 [Caerostris extrusa]|uniref:Uncharacterized protein n=1 Tax=Caerostris extrusa TaxID=172846 RepID=A0AAV4UF53_CAEEX|nr:hypothetical protein CEXT_667711 [Caerostris extrusa]
MRILRPFTTDHRGWSDVESLNVTLFVNSICTYSNPLLTEMKTHICPLLQGFQVVLSLSVYYLYTVNQFHVDIDSDHVNMSNVT